MKGGSSETMGDYAERLAAFVQYLRQRGFRISTSETITAAQGVTGVDSSKREQVRECLRTTLVSSPSEREAFDPLFDAFWAGTVSDGDGDESRRDAVSLEGASPCDAHTMTAENDVTEGDLETHEHGEDAVSDDGRVESEEEAESSHRLDRYGRPNESDRSGDFERVEVKFVRGDDSEDGAIATARIADGDELLPHLVSQFGKRLGALPGYRRRSDPLGEIDLRRTLSVSNHVGPTDFSRRRRERTRAHVRLFVDVSKSMLQHLDRSFLLQFLYECVHQFANVRVFFFDTTAVEVTEHFQAAALREVVAGMKRASVEWGSGTTIGSCLVDIEQTDPFVVDDRTVTVVISDGWDVGDDDLLRTRMARLQRRSKQVLWLNPLAGTDDFEPTVRGLRTALPYADYDFPFSSADDLATMVDTLDAR